MCDRSRPGAAAEHRRRAGHRRGLTMTETKQRKNQGHGEGAIQKRADGRWMAQLMVGTKADGERDIRSVYGKTRGECQKKLADLRRRRDEGLLGDPGAGKETV